MKNGRGICDIVQYPVPVSWRGVRVDVAGGVGGAGVRTVEGCVAGGVLGGGGVAQPSAEELEVELLDVLLLLNFVVGVESRRQERAVT